MVHSIIISILKSSQSGETQNEGEGVEVVQDV